MVKETSIILGNMVNGQGDLSNVRYFDKNGQRDLNDVRSRGKMVKQTSVTYGNMVNCQRGLNNVW